MNAPAPSGGFPDAPGFSDHRGLLSRNLSGLRLIALHGVSGIGNPPGYCRRIRQSGVRPASM